MKQLAALLAAAIVPGVFPGNGQTMVDLRTQTKSVDFSGALSTKPLKTGTVLPGVCAVGELFFKTGSPSGSNVYTCSSPDAWSVLGAGGNYSQTFSNQVSVSLAHNMSTAAITVQCFDNSISPAFLEPNRVTVTDANTVSVTFVKPQSGTCVVNGSAGSGSGGSGSGGSGTVTNTGGPLTADLPVFGNGGADLKAGTKTGTGNQAVMSLSPSIVSPYIIDLTNMQHDHRTPSGGGVLGIGAISPSVLSGNGGRLATVSGPSTGGDCAQFDASGNLADVGFPCGSGQGQSLSAGPGLILQSGALRVNPAAVRTYVTGSGSLNFGTIGANGGCSSRTISVPGAVIGDRLALGPPTELLTYSLALTFAVSAADTVTIRLCDYTASAITPPLLTWNVDVVKSF